MPVKNGFEAKVFNLGKLLSTGCGENKKKAEQSAAQNALDKLEKKEK